MKLAKFLPYLLLPFLTIFFTSCISLKPKVKTVTVYGEKPIYLKCQIPEVPPAELNPIPSNATYPEKLQIILNNCLRLKKENKLLREAIKTCK